MPSTCHQLPRTSAIYDADRARQLRFRKRRTSWGAWQGIFTKNVWLFLIWVLRGRGKWRLRVRWGRELHKANKNPVGGKFLSPASFHWAVIGNLPLIQQAPLCNRRRDRAQLFSACDGGINPTERDLYHLRLHPIQGWKKNVCLRHLRQIHEDNYVDFGWILTLITIL